MSVMVGAGGHKHCDILAARIAHRKPGSFRSAWVRLRDEYKRRLVA